MTTDPDRPSPADDPIALVLEVVVYAPIGAAAYLREVGPDFVRMIAARGRAEVDVRQEQVARGVRHAKGAGEVAIAFGLPVVRRRVEKRLGSLRAPAPKPAAPKPAATNVVQPRPEVAPVREAPVAVTNGHRTVETAEGDRLAIPGYDALSASQVVERLQGLTGVELDAVRRYEAGHRRRRTILGKIEQLTH